MANTKKLYETKYTSAPISGTINLYVTAKYNNSSKAIPIRTQCCNLFFWMKQLRSELSVYFAYQQTHDY